MTQGSMPWNDLGGGDGDPGANHFTSPYSATEWQGLWSAVLTGLSANGFIIQGIGSHGAVTQRGAGANMSVDVASGEGLVNGTRWKSDATENLTITAADATNPRLDRVVLRWTGGSTQTVRVAVLAGTPAATPSLPALTQSSSVWEVDIAHIYVSATVTTITTADIADKRIFAPNFAQMVNFYDANLIANSEFMAFSRLDNNGVTDPGAPDGGWTKVGTCTYASTTRPSQMSRGRAVQITAGAANSGLQQIVRVRASTAYVIKTLINVTAGDVGKIVLTTNSGAPVGLTREVRRTGSWLEETLYYTTEADASTLTVQLLAASNTDIVQVGQLLVVEGYIPGAFRQIRETILFDWLLSDPDFDGDSFGTDGTTTIDFDTDYQGIVLPGTQAVCFFVQISDTNTGTDAYIQFLKTGASYPLSAIDIHGRTNSFTFQDSTGFIPLDTNNQLDIARGVGGTMTLGIYVTGIII